MWIYLISAFIAIFGTTMAYATIIVINSMKSLTVNGHISIMQEKHSILNEEKTEKSNQVGHHSIPNNSIKLK